jgi:hypothetical protein
MPATDKFPAIPQGFANIGPATRAEAVTPSDVDELASYSRSLWVGGAGNVNVVMSDGTTVLISGVAAGTLLPIRVKQVKNTSTTATLMVSFS